MRALAIVLLVVILTAAGCGGGGHPTTAAKPPKLPHALAQSWAQQADSVAAAIDAGDGCTALQRATALRTQVVGAVNAHRVPRRYLEPLVATANDLAARIACTPPAPAVVVTPPPPDRHGNQGDNGRPPKHGEHGKHGKHGGD